MTVGQARRAVEADLSEQAGAAAREAIRAYARAAALEAQTHLVTTASIPGAQSSAGQMWMVVRMLCAEHGIEYHPVFAKAMSDGVRYSHAACDQVGVVRSTIIDVDA